MAEDTIKFIASNTMKYKPLQLINSSTNWTQRKSHAKYSDELIYKERKCVILYHRRSDEVTIAH